MDKNDVFEFAKAEINADIRMYHYTESGEYIFFNSKKHYAGSRTENDILEWIENSHKIQFT